MLPEQILILSSVTTAINRQCQINKTFASEDTVLRAQLSEPVIARALRKDPRSVAARRFENGEKKKGRRRGEGEREKEEISSPPYYAGTDVHARLAHTRLRRSYY